MNRLTALVSAVLSFAALAVCPSPTTGAPRPSTVPPSSPLYRSDTGAAALNAAGPSARPHKPTDITFTDVSSGLPGVGVGAAAWGDYDNDGDVDIALTGSASTGAISRMYRNDGAGVFTDINAGLPGVVFGAIASGDCDNDGDLDILLAGDTGAGRLSRVYRNNGAGLFADANAGLPGVASGATAWGDYDNDGDLDILLTGDTGAGRISRVYRNDGPGAFIDINAVLPSVTSSAVAWGDYDNDGDLDILLTGDTGMGRVSRVYRNNGAGLFADANAGLPGVASGATAWGDYDNDGDLDILLTGDTGAGRISRLYRNNGAGLFADANAGLPGVASGATAWGDYDNDGDLDILLTGDTGTGRVSRVCRNDGPGAFSDINAGLTGIAFGTGVWGDYDNDGDLDVLLAGLTASAPVSIVYRNDGAQPNTPPQTPSGLTASLVGGQVTLTWNASIDGESPPLGLSYNLRIGTTVSGDQICSAMANPANGQRRVIALGNAQQRTSWTFRLPATASTYYWSVQALDGSYAGSAFAPVGRFSVVMFTDINATLPTPNSAVPWADYDNDGDLDILLTGSGANGYWSRVYRNDGNGVFTDSNAGLPGVENFGGDAGRWADYDNDGDLDLLLWGRLAVYGFRNDGNGVLHIWSAPGFYGYNPTADWGDYDNDGDLDLISEADPEDYGGPSICRLHRNVGPGSFVEIDAGLPGARLGSVGWGDYDNDGDLDFLLTGFTGDPGNVTAISRVYRNNGSGVFNDINAGLAGIALGVAVWGDYDDDGDLDVLLGSGKIYRNGGSGTFTDIGAGLPTLRNSAVAWGDYDNDGNLDILLTGDVGTGDAISRVYRNTGAGVFTDIGASLIGVENASVGWGDYDNDGDLDIFLLGQVGAGSSYVVRVYRSDGAPANTPPTTPNSLVAINTRGQLTLSWSAASDVETPSPGLSYNLRIGTTPGGSEVCSAMANSTNGHRRCAGAGKHAEAHVLDD